MAVIIEDQSVLVLVVAGIMGAWCTESVCLRLGFFFT
jgi:hypothetical protein